MPTPQEMTMTYHAALLGELVWLADPSCRLSIPLAASLAAVTARRIVRLADPRQTHGSALTIEDRAYLASIGIK